MSLASYQTALPRAEEKNCKLIDKQELNVPPYHICTNRIAHLYRKVKGALYDHRSLKGNAGIFYPLPTGSCRPWQ